MMVIVVLALSVRMHDSKLGTVFFSRDTQFVPLQIRPGVRFGDLAVMTAILTEVDVAARVVR